MKITKLGHCCLLVEVEGVNVLTDPGAYTDSQNKIKGIDIILITHEHGDHLHAGSLKEVLKNNPKAKVYTNRAVGKFWKWRKLSSTYLREETKKSLAV